MEWKDQVDLLLYVSSLSHRQAQVAVLTERGHTPAEIVDLIDGYEDAPKVETIQSIQSKLHRELLNGSVTQHMLADELSAVRPPIQLADEHTTEGSALHAYIGGIGKGKTVTAQSHALRLADQYDISDFIVLDFIDEWEHVEGSLPGLQRISFEGERPTDRKLLGEKADRLLDKIRSRDEDTHTVVYITQAHYVFSGYPDLVEDIQEAADNLSLRIMSQTVEEFPDGLEADMYHFHGTGHESTETKLKEITSNSAYEPTVDVSGIPYHLPEPVHRVNPAYMVTAIPETGETMVRANVLSDDESEILLDE